MMDTILFESIDNNITDHEMQIVIDAYQNNLFIYDKPLNAILISTYIPLFLIALTSNALIILVVGRYRCLRSVTNYFLVNLAIADLLVTIICMPVAVGQAVHSLWLYGSVMCRLTHYLQAVAVSASIFTITAMSIDRYLAIRHPMSRKVITRRSTRKVIICLWLLSLVIFAPILLIRNLGGFKIGHAVFSHCIEEWPDSLSRKTFGTFCFIVVYLVPGFIVVLAYSLMGLRLCSRQLIPEYQLTQGPSSPHSRNGESSTNCNESTNSAWQVSAAGGRLVRERRRVAKILLILALVFACCWLPYSVISLILDLTAKADKDIRLGGDVEVHGILAVIAELLPFAILLGHVNSAVNPLLYCLLSKNFRRSISEMIRHPTRAVRGRQHCKIRMNFRKEPVVSKDKASNSKEIQGNVVTRPPRNHHAPEPPAPSHSGGSLPEDRIPQPNNNGTPSHLVNNPSGQFKDATEICIVDLKSFSCRGEGYSPSSSGYSSLRHSTDALAIAMLSKDNTFPTSTPPGQSSQYPFYTLPQHHHSIKDIVPHGTGTGISSNRIINDLWNGTYGVPLNNTATNPPLKRCPNELRKLHVPSTICEESESSQRSRSSDVRKNSFYM